MQACIRCGESKELEFEFYKHKAMANGYLSVCKDCVRKRVKLRNLKNGNADDLTKKGVVRVIYKAQVANSKKRGHKPPAYTKEELSAWLYSNGFNDVYGKWIAGGMKKDEKPSVDRVDSNCGYSFENIKLVTWLDNRNSQYSDIRNGVGSSGKRCTKVLQYSLDGELLGEYFSQHEAERVAGVSHSNISANVCGKTKTAGGYVWVKG